MMMCASEWSFALLVFLMFLGGVLIGATLPLLFKKLTIRTIIREMKEDREEHKEILDELEGI